MSILKRIEEIVLDAEARLRNTLQSEADSSKLPTNNQEPSHEPATDSETNRALEFELVEC